MKKQKYFFIPKALLGALGLVLVACGEPVESLLPQPAQQTQETATAETGTIVSESQAINVAEAFFLGQKGEGVRTRSAAELKSPSSIKSIKADAGEAAIHVLNYPGGGFALVSATRDYFPVLAWSDDGSFELAPDMGPVQIWIDETKEAIRVAESLDAETKAAIRAEWRSVEPAIAAKISAASTASAPKTRAGYNAQMESAMYDRMFEAWQQYGSGGWNMAIPLSEARDVLGNEYEWNRLCQQAISYGSPPEYTLFFLKEGYVVSSGVGPLISTKWHQGSPYYYNCNNRPIGCVPIAMAQIMKFFGKPTKAKNMPDIQTSYSQTALTQFLKEVGNSVGIDYSVGDPSATIEDAENSFVSYGYSATPESPNSPNATIDVKDWITSERKPVFMAGMNLSLTGHAWVCDGVRTSFYRRSGFVEFINPVNYTYSGYGYSPSNVIELYSPILPPMTEYHMNWGWNDHNDGWYVGNRVNTAKGDFQLGRNNLYVKP